MLKFVTILLASVSLFAAADSTPIAKPETVGLSSARLERLAQAIKQDVDHGRMPGAVVAIARKGQAYIVALIGGNYWNVTRGGSLAHPKSLLACFAYYVNDVLSIG